MCQPPGTLENMLAGARFFPLFSFFLFSFLSFIYRFSLSLCLASWRACALCVVSSVCVLHIKPFFLPVDIQQTPCPCRFFLLLVERYKLCDHKR